MKFFPDKAIIFTIILRHDIHYASIATDRIYYSNNMTSSLSWYALDDEYVADDLQADPNLMERLERLCSSNSCAGPSLDVINFWQSQISAVELQFNQLLTNKFALVGDVDQTHDHSELRSIDAAINAASLLLSDCNFLSTISGETINSAALDLSAELAATLRRSSMFKDLSISESTIKDTTANCKKSKKMSSGSIDKGTSVGIRSKKFFACNSREELIKLLNSQYNFSSYILLAMIVLFCLVLIYRHG